MEKSEFLLWHSGVSGVSAGKGGEEAGGLARWEQRLWSYGDCYSIGMIPEVYRVRAGQMFARGPGPGTEWTPWPSGECWAVWRPPSDHRRGAAGQREKPWKCVESGPSGKCQENDRAEEGAVGTWVEPRPVWDAQGGPSPGWHSLRGGVKLDRILHLRPRTH